MANLRQQIESLAATFADGVLAVIREASLEDLLASRGAKPPPTGTAASRSSARGRKVKSQRPKTDSAGVQVANAETRTASDPKEQAGAILSELMKHKDGLGSEGLQEKLELTKGQVLPVLRWALSEGRIIKVGAGRASKYRVK